MRIKWVSEEDMAILLKNQGDLRYIGMDTPVLQSVYIPHDTRVIQVITSMGYYEIRVAETELMKALV
jgi:hypothetical protein